jgi:medium-chain acyl-[acyl-carrier-protein] hydrolase
MWIPENRWVAWSRERQQAPGQRLFCFPYAGGGASAFRLWRPDLSDVAEVCPVQLPGREARLAEPPVSDACELVARLADGLGPFLDRPFAFFGHSMGALVAFELARELRRRRQRGPSHLFASGFRAPNRPNPNRPLHALPMADFLRELRAYDGTPHEVLDNALLMELMEPALRADFALHETYRYREEAPLACPVTVLGGRDDVKVSLEDLAGWQRMTTGGHELRLLPGGHFYVHTARSQVLALVASRLAPSAQRSGSRAAPEPPAP